MVDSNISFTMKRVALTSTFTETRNSHNSRPPHLTNSRNGKSTWKLQHLGEASQAKTFSNAEINEPYQNDLTESFCRELTSHNIKRSLMPTLPSQYDVYKLLAHIAWFISELRNEVKKNAFHKDNTSHNIEFDDTLMLSTKSNFYPKIFGEIIEIHEHRDMYSKEVKAYKLTKYGIQLIGL